MNKHAPIEQKYLEDHSKYDGTDIDIKYVKFCYTTGMKRTMLVVLSSILILIGGVYVYTQFSKDTPAVTQEPEMNIENTSPQNTTYTIDGQTYTLFRGYTEREVIPGSASKNTITVFGQPAYGDIDGDGDDDAVVLLVNDTGGSGTFYYVALAINIDAEYFGTDTMLLGDRIAPQTYAIEKNRAIVNYADRAPDEPLGTEPTEAKSLYLQYDPESLKLIEAVVNLDEENEANRQLLTQKMWTWVRTIYNNDTELTPNNPEAFTLIFAEDGTFSATTDCNEVSGEYTVVDTTLSFENISRTKMNCNNSQEEEFYQILTEAETFSGTSDEELMLELGGGSGSVIFQ